MSRKIRPCGHRLLVKLRELDEEQKATEKKTSSGIIYEFKEKETINREQLAVMEARVVELGFSAYKDMHEGKAWCKEGDLVIINRYSGINRDDIEEGEVYRIINDEDVIAVIDGE